MLEHKNQSCFEKSKSDVKVEIETIDFRVRSEKIRNSYRSWNESRRIFGTGCIIQYGKMSKLAELGVCYRRIRQRCQQRKHQYKQVKLEIKHMYPISSAPFYMTEQKMLEDAGCKPCKEGWTMMTLKKVLALKIKDIHQVHCQFWSRGGQGTCSYHKPLWQFCNEQKAICNRRS